MMSEDSSQINMVHSDDNHIFDNVNHQLAHEMHQEEHLGFDDEYDFLTNTIPYKKLSLVSDTENVSTKASAATSDQIAMIAILNNLILKTRILDPMEEPLELSPSVSSSSNVTMLSRFANFQLSDRKAGSKGIFAIFE
uniref:Uncharacterized protein n=1 Tax=Tanacetum cinerariifolium TaxID=118510 RepID=A0A6L2MJ30_TANCI|nr:hypothetical protein [Tanacetum cinerariifolium]